MERHHALNKERGRDLEKRAQNGGDHPAKNDGLSHGSPTTVTGVDRSSVVPSPS